LYHPGDGENGEKVKDLCEELVKDGKIRFYGWSTDDSDRAKIFAKGPNCTAVQQRLNIFEGCKEVLELCETQNLASLNRTPLGMGILTGKFSRKSSVPDDDVRSSWDFSHGDVADKIESLSKIRDILTSEGRTLAQGALCWLWGISNKTVPIPGFKNTEQVKENAGAMNFSPLHKSQIDEIESLLN
jgi:aryl-alcohol dehydrogenase-like predicted oxidoreductase